MKKILIKVEKDYISFSLTSDSNLEDFNKTNVFSGKKIKFTDTFILNNTKIVGKFINNMAEFNNVNKAIIDCSDISYVVLKLLQNSSGIKKIGFKEKRSLSYVECNLLIKNKHVNYINCFTIPEYMYDRFGMLKKANIKYRSKELRVSNLFEDNDLHTYLDIYYQKYIIIDRELLREDIEDFVAFLNINKHLKFIELKIYNYDNIVDILNILKVWDRDNVTILLNFDNSIFNDIKRFKDLEDIYRVKIKVKDNKEYKNKRYIKNVNINMVKAILIIIFLFSLVSIGLCLFLDNKNNKKIENINKSIKEIVLEEDKNEKNNQDTSQNINESNKNNVYYIDYSKMFDKLSSINNDTVGYLKVNNTKVDYPVVKSNDNDYYLTHDFNKEYNIAGWIYMDYRNNVDLLDQNSIIYGHNMLKDSLLFGSLKNTLKASWYKDRDNHIISFNTINENIKWQIFSIYTIETTNDYLITNFKSDEDFNMFIEKIQGRSIYDFNMKLNEEDKILTLSTCYKDDKHRLVIHAKKI